MLGAETDAIDLAEWPSMRWLGKDYKGTRVPDRS